MPDTTNFQKHTNKNPIQQFLIKNYYRELLKTVKPLKPNKILDVGCGEGETIVKLKQARIGRELAGVDNSEDALAIGKKQYRGIDIKLADIYQLPFKDNSFDLVLCTEVLEHLEKPSKALAELRRISSKYVLLSVPNEPFFIIANFLRGKYLKRFGNHPEHINHWTNIGFKNYLRRNRLKVVNSRAPFAWTLVLAKK